LVWAGGTPARESRMAPINVLPPPSFRNKFFTPRRPWLTAACLCQRLKPVPWSSRPDRWLKGLRFPR
jgi:hypothetical protein